MKKSFQLLLVSILVLSISLTSCKKSDVEIPSTVDELTELTTHSDDQANFSGESDAIANDINTIIEENAPFEGRIQNTVGITCNATAVMDSTATLRRITVTYNGPNCRGSHVRTGVVVLTMPLGVRWSNTGAVLTVNIQSLTITRVRDNKSIVLNGTKTITNVTGGRLRNLASAGTIIHRIQSPGLTITFDNGAQRSWQLDKKRTFTYQNGMVISIEGMHSNGTHNNIAEWGTNRFGNAFLTKTTQPMVIRQDCDFRLVSGQLTHIGLAATIDVTYGLNAQGLPTSCPGPSGTYYYKAVWTGANGLVRTVINPY